jgi:hypothetical protein
MSNEDIAKDAANALAEALGTDDTEESDEPDTVKIDGVEHIPVTDKTGPGSVDADNSYGWDTDEMNTSQTDRDVNHEEVDEEYAEVDGEMPDPENDEGSDGMTHTGTKQVSDAVTEDPGDVDPVEIGHLEINEYYRVWIKDPDEAPPEVQVFDAEESQTPPPTEESSHYYEAPFESSVAAVGVENAAEKLAEYEPDGSFPSMRDIEKSEVSQADLWAVSAVQSGSPEKVTRTSVEMVKSPLTLFYVSKRIRGREAWSHVRKCIQDELDKRGIEGVDKVRRADPVEATEPREVNKRKVYVQDESDVPDQYEPQYGPNGGLYYEPDSGSDGDSIETGEDLEDAARKALEEGDVVEDIPVQAWRDLTGEIDDQDLLAKCLDPIQDHGTKTARDRIRQRLRGMGLEGGEIDDLLADSDAPYSAEEHEDWQESYSDMEIVERQSLWGSDAKTGASAEHMSIEELGDGTTAFSTRYGEGGNDPEYRSRQMATYKASRALTAEGNVPPHVHASVEETEGDFDKVAVKEFDGQEAWEAPESYFEEIDRDDYVEQVAKQLLCGNNDLHGDNIMVNEDGDLGFHDLDHSAGRLDQNDPINNGDIIEGALMHMVKTGGYMDVYDDREQFVQDILDEAQEIAEERGDEVRQLLEETDNPFLGEMLDNIVGNLDKIQDAEIENVEPFEIEVNL